MKPGKLSPLYFALTALAAVAAALASLCLEVPLEPGALSAPGSALAPIDAQFALAR